MRTNLQRLMAARGRGVVKELAEQLGRHRSVVSRWRRGQSFPERLDAERLIVIFAADGLDFNGIYQPTEEPEPLPVAGDVASGGE